MVDIKTIAVFLPFGAAACIGVTYTMNSKIMNAVTLPTYVLIYCIIGAVLMLAVHFLSPIKMDFSAVMNWPMATFVVISIFASLGAWLMALVTIKMAIAGTITARIA